MTCLARCTDYDETTPQDACSGRQERLIVQGRDGERGVVGEAAQRFLTRCQEFRDRPAGDGISSGHSLSMNQREFEIMVRTYSADVYRFAYWLSRNSWQAEDLVQETFSAAWRARDSLRDRDAVKPWLFTIARNEFARQFQRKRLDVVDVELEDLPIGIGPEGQERVEIENALQALPENYREPLVLQVLGGFSTREIAQMMGITEPNVMTRLTRARQALHRLVEPATAAAES